MLYNLIEWLIYLCLIASFNNSLQYIESYCYSFLFQTKCTSFIGERRFKWWRLFLAYLITFNSSKYCWLIYFIRSICRIEIHYWMRYSLVIICIIHWFVKIGTLISWPVKIINLIPKKYDWFRFNWFHYKRFLSEGKIILIHRLN